MLPDNISNDEKLQRKRARDAAYYAAHREKILAQQALWYAANKEHIAVYRAANVERERARRAAYYVANKARELAASAAYWVMNREKLAKAQAAYRKANPRKNNPDNIRIRNNKRRTLKRDAAGTFTVADWQSLVVMSPRCHWCKRPWTKIRRPTHDHVIPLARGGSNSLENSCCACLECNWRKGPRLLNPVSGQGVLL